jgi:hypothetical protein
LDKRRKPGPRDDKSPIEKWKLSAESGRAPNRVAHPGSRSAELVAHRLGTASGSDTLPFAHSPASLLLLVPAACVLCAAMLALNPSSICDVCAEEYGSGRAPHCIPCGQPFSPTFLTWPMNSTRTPLRRSHTLQTMLPHHHRKDTAGACARMPLLPPALRGGRGSQAPSRLQRVGQRSQHPEDTDDVHRG